MDWISRLRQKLGKFESITVVLYSICQAMADGGSDRHACTQSLLAFAKLRGHAAKVG